MIYDISSWGDNWFLLFPLIISVQIQYVNKLRKWFSFFFPSIEVNSLVSSVAQSCPTLCDPMDCSTPALLVHHQHPEFTQTHIHGVCDAIRPSHPLSSPSPPPLQSFPASGSFPMWAPRAQKAVLTSPIARKCCGPSLSKQGCLRLPFPHPKSKKLNSLA